MHVYNIFYIQDSDTIQSVKLLSMALSSNTSSTAVVYLLSKAVSAVTEPSTQTAYSTRDYQNFTQVFTSSISIFIIILHLYF